MTKPDLSRRLRLAFLGTLVLLLANGLVSGWNVSKMAMDDVWLDHTHRVLTRLAEVRSALAEAESSQRGYLLTENQIFLRSYEKALPRIRDALAKLTAKVNDNPEQQERVGQLRDLVETRLKSIQHVLTLDEQGADVVLLDVVAVLVVQRAVAVAGPARAVGRQQALAKIRSGQGEAKMEKIRLLFQALVAEEKELLRERTQKSQGHAQVAYLTVALATLMGVALLVLVVAAVRSDLRHRNAAEEVLRQSEEEFRGTFDLAGVAKAQADPDTGRVLRVNRKYCELVGYTETELMGMTFLQLTHPDDRDQNAELFQRLLRGEIADYNMTKRYLRKNGTVVWVHVSAAMIHDSTGRPVRTVAVVQDFTERKRTEDALRQSEARFRLLADTLPQIVWSTGPDGRLTYFNRRWSDYFGLTPEEAWQGQGQGAVHPEDHEGLTQAWQRALQTGEPFETEFRLQRASDGAFRWHLGRALPLRDPYGQVLAWFGTSTDIEDQKRAEQAILQTNEQLEKRVAQRTQQLEATNQDLRTATLLAEAASRAKSEFLASISHEIRTPMNGILGMTEMILDTPLTPPQRDFLQAVQISAQSLLALLNDILDFSKIEAGKLELTPEPFDLRRELDESLKPLLLRAQHKGLSYRCQVDPAIPAVLVGDSLRLRQVLLNLVGNAVKFTEQGEVVVSVEVEKRTTDDTDDTDKDKRLSPSLSVSSVASVVELHFAIRDTGIGIPAEKLRSIFEPFVQADSSLSRKYGGTGLGLSISSRLVEMMGGRIEVVSELDRGSRFSFTIPFGTNPPRGPRGRQGQRDRGTGSADRGANRQCPAPGLPALARPVSRGQRPGSNASTPAGFRPGVCASFWSRTTTSTARWASTCWKSRGTGWPWPTAAGRPWPGWSKRRLTWC